MEGRLREGVGWLYILYDGPDIGARHRAELGPGHDLEILDIRPAASIGGYGLAEEEVIVKEDGDGIEEGI